MKKRGKVCGRGYGENRRSVCSREMRGLQITDPAGNPATERTHGLHKPTSLCFDAERKFHRNPKQRNTSEKGTSFGKTFSSTSFDVRKVLMLFPSILIVLSFSSKLSLIIELFLSISLESDSSESDS